MLIPFPFAYLLGSAALDAWARATDRPELFRTAKHLNTLGLASALVAAVPGVIDYTFAVPPKSSAKTRATNHMLTNVSALAFFALARLGRRGGDAPPRPWAMAAELCGAGLLTSGAWMGGTLVTRNQIGIDHRYADAGKWQVERAIRIRLRAGGGIDVGSVDDLQVDQMKLFRIGIAPGRPRADRTGLRRVRRSLHAQGRVARRRRARVRNRPVPVARLAVRRAHRRRETRPRRRGYRYL